MQISKIFHTISHRHDALEFKIKQFEIKSQVDSLSDIYNFGPVPLSKTNIKVIDDILQYWQHICYKEKISFYFRLIEDISDFSKYINESDLEILIADLVKNAIISIQQSNSTNKCILIKLGKTHGINFIYVYDSGIEFDINTYLTLGISPSSTHLDCGGTGMGFLNIFDTLNTSKSSLSISEIGPISEDNYTKSIAIKFDGLNNFNIYSYRHDLLISDINDSENRIKIDQYLC